MNDMKLDIKAKIGEIFAILIFTGLIIWCLWFGIKGLFLSAKHPMDDLFGHPIWGDVYEGQIEYASSYQKAYQRNIRYRWAGTEYFYVVFSKDLNKAVVVRSTKKWGADFGHDFCNQISRQAKGTAKALRYDVKKKMSGTFDEIEKQGVRVEKEYYLDLLADGICWTQLFTGCMLLLCVVGCVWLYKNAVSDNPKTIPKGVGVVIVVLILAMCLALLYLRNKT